MQEVGKNTKQEVPQITQISDRLTLGPSVAELVQSPGFQVQNSNPWGHKRRSAEE